MIVKNGLLSATAELMVNMIPCEKMNNRKNCCLGLHVQNAARLFISGIGSAEQEQKLGW